MNLMMIMIFFLWILRPKTILLRMTIFITAVVKKIILMMNLKMSLKVVENRGISKRVVTNLFFPFFLVPCETIDNSKFPVEPVAYVLFQMVTAFQAGRMTEDDTEMMMSMCNLALQSAGEEYRFPKKASTVSNHNQLEERSCAGLMFCPVCVKCSKVFPSNTTVRLCDACQTELFKTSSNLPRKMYMYNSVTATLKSFLARPSFVALLSKWKTR